MDSAQSYLKALNQVTEPDRRNSYYVVERTDGKVGPLSLEDLHRWASRMTLRASVPEQVREHFAQAQNLAIYSWFYYPFNVTAQFLAFASVELALRLRLQPKAKTPKFKTMIRQAVRLGLIKDEGFMVAQGRNYETEPRYVDVLIETMPSLRNDLAHGSSMLHNQALSSIQTCADFINQLFTAEAET